MSHLTGGKKSGRTRNRLEMLRTTLIQFRANGLCSGSANDNNARVVGADTPDVKSREIHDVNQGI
jgi:hypothetical protein